MTKTKQRCAAGCRKRTPQLEHRWPAWYRQMRRLNCALRASRWAIDASSRVARRCRRTGSYRPVGASRQLVEAAARLTAASERLTAAAAHLRGMNECMAREKDVPCADAFLRGSLKSWTSARLSVEQISAYIDATQASLQAGMRSGEPQPQPRPQLRRRIRLTAPLASTWAFLVVRQSSVSDRIAPLLRRRRRTPCPAEARVPRADVLGRAPPLVSIFLV